MNRRRRGHAVESLISKSKDLFNNKLSTIPNVAIASTSRFRGKLGSTIAIITSLTVGFLTLPNNILYFIDNRHGTRIVVRTAACPDQSSPPDPGTTIKSPHIRADYEYAYIHAGIAFITIGLVSMVGSIVLSIFAAKSKVKMDNFGSMNRHPESTRSTRTVLTCLILINTQLFMSVIAGCMELLYRPLISDAKRLHSVECAIAVFNIILYVMYVMIIVMTSTVLREKIENSMINHTRDLQVEVVTPPTCKDHMYRSGNIHGTQSSFM